MTTTFVTLLHTKGKQLLLSSNFVQLSRKDINPTFVKDNVVSLCISLRLLDKTLFSRFGKFKIAEQNRYPMIYFVVISASCDYGCLRQ